MMRLCSLVLLLCLPASAQLIVSTSSHTSDGSNTLTVRYDASQVAGGGIRVMINSQLAGEVPLSEHERIGTFHFDSIPDGKYRCQVLVLRTLGSNDVVAEGISTAFMSGGSTVATGANFNMRHAIDSQQDVDLDTDNRLEKLRRLKRTLAEKRKRDSPGTSPAEHVEFDPAASLDDATNLAKSLVNAHQNGDFRDVEAAIAEAEQTRSKVREQLNKARMLHEQAMEKHAHMTGQMPALPDEASFGVPPEAIKSAADAIRRQHGTEQAPSPPPADSDFHQHLVGQMAAAKAQHAEAMRKHETMMKLMHAQQAEHSRRMQEHVKEMRANRRNAEL